MSAADHLVDFDDDISRIPRTPKPDEIPTLVRELVRMTASHARQLRAMRQLVWGVVIAVMLGSLGVVATVAGAAWSLGARMERLESVSLRVERLERVEEAGR
jgi:hypothetical protein